MLGKIRQIDIKSSRIKFHPHQKQIGFFVGVLVSMENVAVVAENEIRDRRDNALAVGTRIKRTAEFFIL